jgi:hypothetical protein
VTIKISPEKLSEVNREELSGKDEVLHGVHPRTFPVSAELILSVTILKSLKSHSLQIVYFMFRQSHSSMRMCHSLI